MSQRSERSAQADPVLEALRRELEELGLSPYQTRVLLVLLQLGSANTQQIARLSGVPRTSTYQVLDELSGKGIASRLPGDGPAIWSAPSRDEVLERLDAALNEAQEQRLLQHRAHAARVRELLSSSLPEPAPSTPLYVQVMTTSIETKKTYDRLLGEAETELLMFTRTPFFTPEEDVNPSVIAALARGVEMRALYQASDIDAAHAEPWLKELEAYHAAGVHGRVVPVLPVKLVVFDRRTVLVGMPPPTDPDGAYPTFMLIDHQGYAEVQAAAFEKYWESAQPYRRRRRRNPPAASAGIEASA